MAFHGAATRLTLIVHCKGCQRPIPAGVEAIPGDAVAVRCPLCGEHRQYRPTEVDKGRTHYIASGSGQQRT